MLQMGLIKMKLTEVIEKLKHRTPAFADLHQLPKYSILLPLVEVENEIHVLFEVRSMKLRRQPGQICLPGGRIEKDDLDQQHCAIRETAEELGLKEDDIEAVLPMDIMVLPHMHHLLYLFVGKIKDISQIKPNEDEVGEVFTVPLKFLIETKPEKYRMQLKPEPEKGFPFELIDGYDYKEMERHIDHYFYQYNGKVIWGLTARVVKHFLELLETEN